MGSLVIGTEIIAIKDAIKQIRRNIQELKEKKSQLPPDGAQVILSFYENKIAAQNAALIWLKRSL